MLTVIGQVATRLGLVRQVDLAGDVDLWQLPAGSYLRDQPADLPLLMRHDRSWRLGTVGHLERSAADGLMMVGQITSGDDLADLLADGPWYLSAGVRTVPMGGTEHGLARMHEVSLTRSPANCGLKPVRWSRSDLALDSGSQPAGLPLNWHDTWGRAHEAMSARRYRNAPDRLTVVDVDELATRRRRALATPMPTRATRATTPKRATAPTMKRAEAEAAAAEAGASGYGWVGADGQRRRVVRGGAVIAFE
jgi:hypothetical protein